MLGAPEESSGPTTAPRFAGGEAAGLFLLAVLGGVWAWWAWQDGAYFGTVFLPGAILICLLAILVARFAPWPGGFRLPRTAVVVIAALAGLGIWALLSAIWSPSPDVAITDGQRVLLYALAFGLGAWLTVLLGPRVGLGLVPVAFGGLVAGIVAVVALLTSDAPRDILDSGTLDYPIGYRNAEAAFFAIAMFCSVGLAADARRAPWLRGVALGTATLSVDCFLLSQSRGSALAIGIALVVYALAAPSRVRALCWLALALLPAIAIVAPHTDLNDADKHGVADSVDEMRTAGTVAAVTAAGAALLGFLAALFEPRLPGLRTESPSGNRFVAVAMAALAVAAAAVFVVSVGDPLDWIGKRAEEFRQGGSPDLSGRSSRFAISLSSDRSDLWRVALDDAGDEPLLGDGGGGYQDSYLRERDYSYQQVHDAHSVEFETLAEFGIPGLALLLTAMVAGAVGVLAALRRGPPGSGFAAIVAATAAYWFVHTSIDWFWPYPAVTAPVMAVVGGACALRLRGASASRRLPWRPLLGVGAAVLAISAVPPFLAERYIDDAYASWRSDLGEAYAQLDRAEDLNPLSDDALLAEAAISIAARHPERAMAALSEAERKRPEEWATHFLLAKLNARGDRAEARRQIAIALELNPREDRIRALARSLGVAPPAP